MYQALTQDYMNKVLDHTLGVARLDFSEHPHVALFTVTSRGWKELSGRGYRRLPVIFRAADDGATSNVTSLTWTDMPQAKVMGVGITPSFDGPVIWRGPLRNSIEVEAAGLFELLEGQLEILFPQKG